LKEKEAMNIIKGSTPTANASRIMRRLCKHWSHKYPVQFDEQQGVIELTNVRCSMQALADRLDVQLESADVVPLRLTGVVSEHMQRMAGEEQLVTSWEEPVNV
jgi:hypothetical protein